MTRVDSVKRGRDGRAAGALRPTRITPGVLDYAEGSALIEMGRTRVLCAASVESRVPPFLQGQDQGWVTAEYALLPRSTHTRTRRERGQSDLREWQVEGRRLSPPGQG